MSVEGFLDFPVEGLTIGIVFAPPERRPNRPAPDPFTPYPGFTELEDTEESTDELRENCVRVFGERMVAGYDVAYLNYDLIDGDDANDDLDEVGQDAEDRYFDGEESVVEENVAVTGAMEIEEVRPAVVESPMWGVLQ